MPLVSTGSRASIELRGTPIPGAEDRQRRIAGFDQDAFSKSSALCIGAGGINSMIAPTLVRKGVGRITLLDADIVEPSNLNRQRFYIRDVGENKAIALALNIQREAIVASEIRGYALSFEEAYCLDIGLECDVAICGIDNNPGRVAVSRYFREKGLPVIFVAVSRDADHGYVFVQDTAGPCIACMFPDIANDNRYPCPGTPAIADILQTLGGIAVYAVDSLLMNRPRAWNYRRIALADASSDGAALISARENCAICGERGTEHG